MNMPIFDFIASLERDIAELYGKLQSIAQLQNSTELFQYMKEHSMRHSDIVGNLTSKHVKPEIDLAVIRNVHEQIKKTLIEAMFESSDIKSAIDKLARNEELVGKMYQVLADYYLKLSDHYKTISMEIGRVAADEMQHRDMALREKEKY